MSKKEKPKRLLSLVLALAMVFACFAGTFSEEAFAESSVDGTWVLETKETSGSVEFNYSAKFEIESGAYTYTAKLGGTEKIAVDPAPLEEGGSEEAENPNDADAQQRKDAAGTYKGTKTFSLDVPGLDTTLNLEYDYTVTLGEDGTYEYEVEIKGIPEGVDIETPKDPEKPEAKVLELEDKATGIKAYAEAGVMPEGAKLVVREISSGAFYDKVAALLGDGAKGFKLYDIYFETADGSHVQPQVGKVKMSYPVPSAYSEGNTALYRINDEGATKTEMPGSADNGYFVVMHERFSYYTLVNVPAPAPGSQEEQGTGSQPSGGSTGTTDSDAAGTTGGSEAGTGSSGSTSGSGSETSQTDADTVKTGDENNQALWLMLFAGSITAAAAVCVISRKRRHN